jgi:oxygen-independent coproporphyrinogen-3 oxidase
MISFFDIEASEMETKSLYIHFPFCESKCHYCDFYSLGKSRTRPEDSVNFQTALISEARLVQSQLSPTLDTIFFGGGTPSMTTPAFMADLMKELNQFTRATESTEWTMEANPSSVHLESLKEYRALGINRISMGVQSMKDSLLTILGRVHSEKDALAALENIFEAGFSNVSVDLLCGVPKQSIEDLETALTQLTQFPIKHLSCYLLTLPPHHAMYKELPNEDIQLEHLQFVDQWMTKNEFEHYEISNYAKPGFRSQHNMNYWKNRSYLGLGPSAHSFNAQTRTRWKNFSSIHKYAQYLSENKLPVEWTENLSDYQLELEKWMLALRLNDGFPMTWLDNQGRKTKSQTLQHSGLLEIHPLHVDRMRLTSRGFAMSDQVIRELA